MTTRVLEQRHARPKAAFLVALLALGSGAAYGQVTWLYPIHHEAPSWSSTGLVAYRDRGIVYVDEYGAYLTSDSLAGIWVINPETEEKWRVLPWGRSPDWSPDGTQLVVTTGQIYTVNVDGTGLSLLTTAGRDFFPAWSPDGEWIAFDSDYSLEHFAVWIMRSNGTDRQVAGPPWTREPNWSPDGAMIVHVSGSLQVATMNRQGDEIRELTTVGRNSSPEYSPDGSQIAYERLGVGLQIWVMNADGSSNRQLTTRGAGGPSWSPDGTRIVFSRIDSTNDAPDMGVLWVIDVETGEETQLTHKWPEECATWPNCDTPVEGKSWSQMKRLYGK